MKNPPTTTPSVVVVTGASAGIGRSAAVELARRGFGVVATYHSRPEGAEQTIAQIAEVGGRGVAVPLDVSRTETFPAFRDALSTALAATWQTTTIHGIVNNAGFGGGRTFDEMTEEHFDAYYRALLRGPYFFTQSLLPLLEYGGSIVGVSSSSVRPGETEAGYSGYAGMKAGLVVASRYLAKELSPRGIRVNTVAPGPTRTRIGDDAFARFPELADQIGSRTPLGRLGEPEDIGRVIAFLISADAAWITGQDIQVAGGYAL